VEGKHRENKENINKANGTQCNLKIAYKKVVVKTKKY
jgi:hypothetical protein